MPSKKTPYIGGEYIEKVIPCSPLVCDCGRVSFISHKDISLYSWRDSIPFQCKCKKKWNVKWIREGKYFPSNSTMDSIQALSTIEIYNLNGDRMDKYIREKNRFTCSNLYPDDFQSKYRGLTVNTSRIIYDINHRHRIRLCNPFVDMSSSEQYSDPCFIKHLIPGDVAYSSFYDAIVLILEGTLFTNPLDDYYDCLILSDHEIEGKTVSVERRHLTFTGHPNETVLSRIEEEYDVRIKNEKKKG